MEIEITGRLEEREGSFVITVEDDDVISKESKTLILDVII